MGAFDGALGLSYTRVIRLLLIQIVDTNLF